MDSTCSKRGRISFFSKSSRSNGWSEILSGRRHNIDVKRLVKFKKRRESLRKSVSASNPTTGRGWYRSVDQSQRPPRDIKTWCSEAMRFKPPITPLDQGDALERRKTQVFGHSARKQGGMQSVINSSDRFATVDPAVSRKRIPLILPLS